MRPTSYLLWKLKIIVVLVVCFSFSLSLLSGFMFDILLQEHPVKWCFRFQCEYCKESCRLVKKGNVLEFVASRYTWHNSVFWMDKVGKYFY